MIVYRLEHVTCKYALNHGPRAGIPEGCIDWPTFGGAGRSPKEIEEHELCGVTDDQAYDWWDECETDHSCPEGWAFIEYHLEDSDENTYWREDNNQIVFDPRHAYRLDMELVDA